MDFKRVKIGFVPTRRNLFSSDAAVEYADLTRNKLEEIGVNFVDIDDINEDGLLYDDEGVNKIYSKFKEEDIDGIFIANENFGTEYAVARLASKFDVPVLLWGPKDERPSKEGTRQRDTQCGLFAIGKVLRRFNVKFTYIKNSDVDSVEFERGIIDFIKVCNVVKNFKKTRVLQIGPRPFDFWSVIVNEGELLEKFNISLSPIPLDELYDEIDSLDDNDDEVQKAIEFFDNNTIVDIEDKDLLLTCKLKVAIDNLCKRYGCNCGVIQEWNALHKKIGISAYAALSLLQDEEIPFSCETDIHGVISQVIINSATLGENMAMLADVNCRHPEDENGELFQHLGVFPYSLADSKPKLPKTHFIFDYPGAVEFKAKEGKYTICRFDGDHGKYNLLIGNADSMDGPYNQGTYLYLKFDNLNRFESKLVYGPYIHHVAALNSDVVNVLYESCKYIGVEVDLYDPIEEDIKSYWRGDIK